MAKQGGDPLKAGQMLGDAISWRRCHQVDAHPCNPALPAGLWEQHCPRGSAVRC